VFEAMIRQISALNQSTHPDSSRPLQWQRAISWPALTKNQHPCDIILCLRIGTRIRFAKGHVQFQARYSTIPEPVETQSLAPSPDMHGPSTTHRTGRPQLFMRPPHATGHDDRAEQQP